MRASPPRLLPVLKQINNAASAEKVVAQVARSSPTSCQGRRARESEVVGGTRDGCERLEICTRIQRRVGWCGQMPPWCRPVGSFWDPPMDRVGSGLFVSSARVRALRDTSASSESATAWQSSWQSGLRDSGRTTCCRLMSVIQGIYNIQPGTTRVSKVGLGFGHNLPREPRERVGVVAGAPRASGVSRKRAYNQRECRQGRRAYSARVLETAISLCGPKGARTSRPWR